MIAVLKVIGIVVLCLFVLTFVVYLTNADMKLVEKIYDALIKYHDSKHIDEHI